MESSGESNPKAINTKTVNIKAVKSAQFLSIKDMALVAIFAALICVSAFIKIPAGPVPFTLQTFGVYLTAGVLGTKKGTISVVIYILLGLIGIPVFAGNGGATAIVGPTGGFITGFIISAIAIGFIINIYKGTNEKIKMAVTVLAMLVGEILVLAIGTIQFVVVMKTSVIVALTNCVIPFIIPDVIKVILAAILADRLKKYIKILSN